ncbi:helix-turn-helix domain containing protein [Exiguobacterium sp. SL14]|nr:TetR/AcrR family transcriptional regulator [Exiguobacterium sp. SL14]MCY1691340.1 helix-turn-helix domain containing protein [Exiguobacterium sp. SL14]
MTSQSIMQVALKQFAEKGFEATTLSTIGTECGMKKQSIYSHFVSKDALFLQIYEETLKNEIEYIDRWISRHESNHLITLLRNFIEDYLSRHLLDDGMTFFYRFAFYAPEQFKTRVEAGTEQFISHLEQQFIALFKRREEQLTSIAPPEACALHYLTMFDGLIVGCLYDSPERFIQRKSVALDLFIHAFVKEDLFID